MVLNEDGINIDIFPTKIYKTFSIFKSEGRLRTIACVQVFSKNFRMTTNTKCI